MIDRNWCVPVRHNKTGRIYFLLSKVEDCTNVRAGTVMYLYVNMEGQMFVREEGEFWAKFTLLAEDDVVN